jgi:hypothetical protein
MISAARSLARTLPRVMYCRLPRKSGKASVVSSSTFTKPGGPPRCWTYGHPVSETVARKTVSRAAMNAISRSSKRVQTRVAALWAATARLPFSCCAVITAGVEAMSRKD